MTGGEGEGGPDMTGGEGKGVPDMKHALMG